MSANTQMLLARAPQDLPHAVRNVRHRRDVRFWH